MGNQMKLPDSYLFPLPRAHIIDSRDTGDAHFCSWRGNGKKKKKGFGFSQKLSELLTEISEGVPADLIAMQPSCLFS